MCSEERPPTFQPKSALLKRTRRARGSEGTGTEIYYKSEVAGYVSMMADEAREMRCYDATGCTNSALICFLSEPTLVQGEQPIRYVTTLAKQKPLHELIFAPHYSSLTPFLWIRGSKQFSTFLHVV